ncbi:MAG: YggT family protein [Anaerolineae bacterium]|nr:YggT family protein [Anaerolineae bacterium]
MGIFISIFNLLYNIIFILLLARAVLSWIRPDPYHHIWGPIMRIVYQLTEPMLAPIRRMLPQTGMVDWSPMVLIIGLIVLRSILYSILF